MGKKRVSITPAVLKEAVARAASSAGTAVYEDWNDAELKYLTLRQRGKAVTWLVRAYNVTRKIGVGTGQHKDPEFLSVTQAKERARETYVKIASERGVRPVAGKAWTWEDLDREYQASLMVHREVGNRTKPPSRGTQDDVRLMLAKAPLQKLHKRKLTDLRFEHLQNAIEQIHKVNGHRVACKALTYSKSALTWALAKRGLKSGLAGSMPWWTAMLPPDPTGEEIIERKKRRKKLADDKVAFTIEHMAKLLLIHEEFCSNRTASEKIGPGVRFGLWFLAFTGGRRAATTAFERKGLDQSDPRGRDGWGIAKWPEESMKGKSEFWMPLPPAVLSIANGAGVDWDQLVSNAVGLHHGLTSRWIFPSFRTPDEDVATYPSSLNAHLRSMRGTKKSGANKENLLAELPYFTLHLVRSVVGNYLDDRDDVPKPAISAMLSHADGDTDDKLSDVTEKFYIQNQKMRLKSIAMAVWSEALIAEIEKQGGSLPQPWETFRVSKVRSKAA